MYLPQLHQCSGVVSQKIVTFYIGKFYPFNPPVMGVMTQMPRPKRIHVLLSKLFGGTMVFWILWRAKHDWPDLLVS